MGNLQKYTRVDAPRIIDHNDRKSGKPSNKDIDPSRTHLNYSLISDDKTAQERYAERMGDLYCYNRKDVKTLCSWVITAPKTLDETQREAFFGACYDFVADRYGEDNMVQAQVHLDEVTPHIHIAYIPAIYDEKREREKVCANDVNNRMDLITFHSDLGAALRERGIRAEVCSGVTREQGGNRTIAQLKAERDKDATVEKKVDTPDRPASRENPACDNRDEIDIEEILNNTKEFRLEDYVSEPRLMEREKERDLDIERK